LKNGKGSLELTCSPELWSPENPKLYDVYVTAGIDSIQERTGFREIRVEGTQIFLNGTSIKLKGVCSHEESVPNGKSVTNDEIRENFSLVKELKGNFVRLAHYPHTEQAARIADEVGILLWEEIPVYWAILFENEETISNGRQQLTELIKRDYNRPSVIIWSVGNENPDTDDRLAFMGGLADLARTLDDTRAVSAACLWDQQKMKIDDRLASKLDIIGINEYFGWYNPHFDQLEQFFANSNPDKPVIITEFGAGAKAGHHGGRNEMFTEEYQERT
jgi:beta-glucuronidase